MFEPLSSIHSLSVYMQGQVLLDNLFVKKVLLGMVYLGSREGLENNKVWIFVQALIIIQS